MKVNASAVLVFLKDTKLNVEFVVSSDQRAAVVVPEELVELLLLEELTRELELLDEEISEELLELEGTEELLGTLEELPVPPHATPLKVKLVGMLVVGLLTRNPAFTLPPAARLPL